MRRAPQQAMSEKGKVVYEAIRSVKGNRRLLKLLLKRERAKQAKVT